MHWGGAFLRGPTNRHQQQKEKRTPLHVLSPNTLKLNVEFYSDVFRNSDYGNLLVLKLRKSETTRWVQ